MVLLRVLDPSAVGLVLGEVTTLGALAGTEPPPTPAIVSRQIIKAVAVDRQ
jgi:hypothetical protein